MGVTGADVRDNMTSYYKMGHLRQGPEGSFVEHRPVGVLRQRGRV